MEDEIKKIMNYLGINRERVETEIKNTMDNLGSNRETAIEYINALIEEQEEQFQEVYEDIINSSL